MLVYRVVPGSFGNFKSDIIPFLQLPALFLAAAVQSTDAGTVESLPGRATRAAEPRSVRAAATSPSRWRACCRGLRPLLASARAIKEPQKPIPLALLPFPRSHAAEHRRRPA